MVKMFCGVVGWGCLRRPILFRLAGKEWGEKGRWLRFGAYCGYGLGKSLFLGITNTRTHPTGVTTKSDGTKEKITLPKSNVLLYTLENDCWMCVRRDSADAPNSQHQRKH